MADEPENSFSSGSEIVFDFFCELCIDDNKQVEADGYCVDCREYLCASCYSCHRKSRPTRHHVLQDKSNMPKDKPLSTDRVSKDITTKCKVHIGEPVKYYCKSHAVLGCANCFATDHRNCADVESVAKKSENILESQGYNDFISKLKLIQQTSCDIEARARENKAVSQRCYTDVVSTVRKLKQEAIIILNEFEQNTVTLAKKIMSENEEKMESVVENCKVFSENILKLSSEFENLQSSKRVCQLYVNMRENEDKVKTIQEKLTGLEEVNVVRMLTYEPNAELTSLLRRPDILGKISHKCQQVKTPNTVNTLDHKSITVTELADTRARSKNDTTGCHFSGLDVISNNRLIITDANNNKVKLVDTHKNTIISELKLSSKPWDITVFNGSQAAVTLPENKTILIMKVSPSLTKEMELAVRGQCRGVAYSQDRLLVTFVDKPCLEIIDLLGNVIRTIENDSDGSKLFKLPNYVCVSRDGETIFVSDEEHDTVTSLTFDGVVNVLYKDKELSHPHKVCTDYYGNVYVCGSWSRNVHMITADCKKTKVILTQADGLHSNVHTVSHCQDTNRLFIGKRGDVVKTYQLDFT